MYGHNRHTIKKKALDTRFDATGLILVYLWQQVARLILVYNYLIALMQDTLMQNAAIILHEVTSEMHFACASQLLLRKV